MKVLVIAASAAVLLALTTSAAGSPQVKLPGTIAFTESHACRASDSRCATVDDVFLATPSGKVERVSRGAESTTAFSWSPDGSRLLVCRGRTCRRGFFAMNLGGRITGIAPAGVFGAPVWSPDGSRLVFTDYDGVHVVNADGRGRRAIVSDAWLSWLKRRGWGWGLGGLCWSHDGTHVVFEALRGRTQLLLAVRADRIALATPRRIYQGQSGSGLSPACSPATSTVAFSEQAPADINSGTISTVRLDGTGLTRLRAGHSPSWSPDGSLIAYGRGMGAATMRPDGTGVRRLACKCWAPNLSWAPDGSRVAYAATVGSGEAIYTVNLDGSGATRVAFSARMDIQLTAPLWRPDARQRTGSG